MLLALTSVMGQVGAVNLPAPTDDETSTSDTSAELPIIPYPASLTRGEGTLALSGLTAVNYAVADSTQALAEDLAAQLNAAAGLTLKATAGNGTAVAGAINFVYASQADGDEAYTLVVDASGITITAQAGAGFFYAVQTLKQMLPVAIFCVDEEELPDTTAVWSLPYVSIADAPLLGHRGFMLDESRHFFGIGEVKKLIDVASTYKLNRFHWHLTDDQGWRVEIPEYPRLTTVGAVRKGSLVINDPTNGVEFYDDTEYGRGCYYTLDQLAEVVAYAKERHVEIIPEIDLPGHMVAAIAAYPELSCDPDKTYEVRIEKGISSDVLNVGSDSVIDFLKCVLGHIATVFPYQYIHIGGDECPTDAWLNNADCQKRIEEEGLSTVNDLQPWLVETLGSWLKSEYGKDIIVWDELLAYWDDSYTTEPVFMAWHSTAYTSTAANKGFKSICVPYLPLYFDQLQAEVSDLKVDEPYMGGYGDGTVNTVEEVYNFNPLVSVSGKEEYVLGTQANLWTESCSTQFQLEYQLFPRLLALSEAAWLPTTKKDYTNFLARLQDNIAILTQKYISYAEHVIVKPELTAAEEALEEALNIRIYSQPGDVGHPSQADYDALTKAYRTLANISEPTDDDVNALLTAIETYKNAEIKQPEAGKIYEIASAAIYFRTRYNGSTVYAAGDGLKFHYTSQFEPEELWYITPQATGGYIITQVGSSKAVEMPTYNAPLTLSDGGGTPVRFDIANQPTGNYTYRPGVLTITAWADSTASSARRFYGTSAGTVIAYDSTATCSPAGWRIYETYGFDYYLNKLYQKCVRIIAESDPKSYGEPTQEALDFLQEKLVTPAAESLNDSVTEEIYLKYVDIYQQFTEMETVGLIESLDESHLYRLRNAYYTDYYACVNTATLSVRPQQLGTGGDNYNWVIRKNNDGTATLFSAFNGKPAYVVFNSTNAQVKVGRDYNWTLREVENSQGETCIAIIDATDTYGWFINPGAWAYVLLKPSDQNACIWTFEKLTAEVPTGINQVTTDGSANTTDETIYYDLSGRRVTQPANGIYITNRHTKVKK